jgi:hypothetical protein
LKQKNTLGVHFENSIEEEKLPRYETFVKNGNLKLRGSHKTNGSKQLLKEDSLISLDLDDDDDISP